MWDDPAGAGRLPALTMNMAVGADWPLFASARLAGFANRIANARERDDQNFSLVNRSERRGEVAAALLGTELQVSALLSGVAMIVVSTSRPCFKS